MEPVVIPYVYDKNYGKAIAQFKMYVVSMLFLKDIEEFEELFDIETSSEYITLTKRRDYSRNRYKKRFKRNKPAIFTNEDVDYLTEYAEEKRKEIREEKRFHFVMERAGKLVKKLLEKYEEYNEDENDGFSLEFNYYRVDYPNSIYIRYKPLDKYNLTQEKVYEFSGYSKEDREDTFEDDDIEEIDNLPENEIIALLNREDTPYDFVITSYKKRVIRFGEVVSMYILIDGTFTTPEFSLDSDYLKTLDNIIRLGDMCIEWQIEIMEFAEKIKSEINPKYFELSKY